MRYYEEKGLIRVSRDAGNRRIYSDTDVEWVKFLQRLKHTGMCLKDMKLYAVLRYEGESTMPQRLELLIKHRKYVDEQLRLWNAYSRNLDDKMEYYLAKIEKRN